MLSSYWQQVLALAGVNALGAWSLSIAIRSGQLSAGQAAFSGVAGYVAATVTRDFDQPLAVAVVVGFVVGALLGFAVRLVFLRLAHLLFAIATLAFGEMAAIAMANIDKGRFGGTEGMGGMDLSASLEVVASVVVAAALLEVVIVRRSAFDLRGRLVAEDDSLVGLGGHSPAWVKLLTFALSTGIAGVAGALFVHVVGFIEPANLQFGPSFNWLVFAVVGGAFSGYGAMLGAALLTIAPEIVPYADKNRALFYGISLLLVMLLRPQGIVGRHPVPVLEGLLGRREVGELLRRDDEKPSHGPAAAVDKVP